MFSRIRTQWYYSKLEHVRGEKFIKAVSKISALKTSHVIPYLLEIMVSRTDLTFEEKAALAEAFVAMGPEASRYLINSVYDENGLIRYSVVSALGHMRETDAVPLFSFLLESSDEAIFAKALGDIGSADALPVLRERVLNHDSHTRLESLEALRLIDAKGNVDVLLTLLRDEESVLRKVAATVLKSIGYQSSNPVDQMLLCAACNKIDQISVDSKEAGLALLNYCDKTDEILCERILDKISEKSYPGQDEVYQAFLQELPAEYRRGLIDMIDHASPLLLDTIFPLLYSSNMHLKRACEKLLMRSGSNAGKRAIDYLSNNKKKPLLVRTALVLIAASTLTDEITFLVDRLTSDKGEQLIALLEVAAEMHEPELAKPIRALLKEVDDLDTQLYAVYALGEIQDRKALSLFHTSLNHVERDFRIALYDALRKISDPASLQPLKNVNTKYFDSEELDIYTTTLKTIQLSAANFK